MQKFRFALLGLAAVMFAAAPAIAQDTSDSGSDAPSFFMRAVIT